MTTHGPISQRQFLRETGIEIRANMLLEKNPRISDDITKSLVLLISPDEMGERFKFMCLFPNTMEEIHSKSDLHKYILIMYTFYYIAQIISTAHSIATQ